MPDVRNNANAHAIPTETAHRPKVDHDAGKPLQETAYETTIAAASETMTSAMAKRIHSC